jgi:hypothetical protein
MRGCTCTRCRSFHPGDTLRRPRVPGRDHPIPDILVTLVLQGLTLPWLIRFLGLGGADKDRSEETYARLQMLDAAQAYLDAETVSSSVETAWAAADLIHHHELYIGASLAEQTGETPTGTTRRQAIAIQVLNIQRRVILDLRTQGRISDTLLRTLERDLDLERRTHSTRRADYRKRNDHHGRQSAFSLANSGWGRENANSRFLDLLYR